MIEWINPWSEITVCHYNKLYYAVAISGYTFTRWSDGVTFASPQRIEDCHKSLSAIFIAGVS